MFTPSRVWVIAAVIGAVVVADVAVVASRSGDGAGAPAAISSARGGRERKGRAGDANRRTDGGAARTTGPGANGPATTGVPDELPAYRPPEPGVYRHRTTRATANSLGTSETTNGTTTYTFEPGTLAGEVFTQTVRIRQSGQRNTQRRTSEWRPGGLYRIQDRYTKDAACTWDPVRLILRFPVAVGDEWTNEVHCREPDRQQTEVTVTTAERDRVVRSQTLRVDGRDVRCFVVKVVTETTYEGESGSGKTVEMDLLWYAPRYRLIVRTETTVHAEVTYQGVPTSSDVSSTSRLVNLEPD